MTNYSVMLKEEKLKKDNRDIKKKEKHAKQEETAHQQEYLKNIKILNKEVRKVLKEIDDTFLKTMIKNLKSRHTFKLDKSLVDVVVCCNSNFHLKTTNIIKKQLTSLDEQGINFTFDTGHRSNDHTWYDADGAPHGNIDWYNIGPSISIEIVENVESSAHK